MIIEPDRTAVLALHFTRDVIEPDRPFGAFFNMMVVENGVLQHTSQVLDAARDAGATVVYARVVFPRGYEGIEPSTALYRMVIEANVLQAGSDGIDIVHELAPHPEDVVIDHLGTSAFVGGELDQLLKARGIGTIVITGVTTNVIVEGTARDGGNRDLRTFVLADCCSAGDVATHEASLATLGMIIDGVSTSEEFLAALKAEVA